MWVVALGFQRNRERTLKMKEDLVLALLKTVVSLSANCFLFWILSSLLKNWKLDLIPF